MVIEAEEAISSILIMADLWLFLPCFSYALSAPGAGLQGWVLYRLQNWIGLVGYRLPLLAF